MSKLSTNKAHKGAKTHNIKKIDKFLWLYPDPVSVSDGDRVVNALFTDGYVVIAPVLTSEECDKVEENISKDLCTMCPKGVLKGTPWSEIDRDAMVLDMPQENDLRRTKGFVHSESFWYVRTHPLVKKAWEHIYSSDDLVVSLDAGVCGKEIVDINQTQWLHTDQAPRLAGSEYYMIQGSVIVSNTDPNTSGCTVVVPYSHHRYQERAKNNNPPHHHWRIGEDVEIAAEARCIFVPRGGMILWNSKTLHQGWTGKRLGFMVCYVPKKWRTEEVRRMKIASYLSGRCNSHWPQYSHGSPYEPRITKYAYNDLVPKYEETKESKKYLRKTYLPGMKIDDILKLDFDILELLVPKDRLRLL